MKPLSLSVVLAVAFASPMVHGSETEPSAPDASPHVIPALYTPSTITPSGHEFIARCDDEAFAKARFKRDLAERCEDVLRRWHLEASNLGKQSAGTGIERVGAPRFLPPPTPLRAALRPAG